MNEEDYQKLLDIIGGRGEWHFGNAGFHTYPGHSDNQEGLHEACCELERRGLVKRVIDEPGHCCFVISNA